MAASLPLFATVFATVHGVVHDSQHRPIAGAEVTLKAADSEFVLHAKSSADGAFELPQAPIGVYRLTVAAPGFETVTEELSVASGTNPVLHIPLAVGAATQSVVVHGAMSSADTVTPTTLVTRAMIDETPGASRTLGMEMITDFVPGAYMTHDMLHMRGGHQTSWLIDGVAIPNTKIASNVGPQIDPKDIDSLETQRGSYGADVGDRTYGVFDVLPRNGFERNREGELVVSGGNLDSGEVQLSLGDHTGKTAWYGSLTGSRSNYGLATPVAEIDHDATNSQSGFVSLIRNQTAKDQLRLNAQYRQDYFQVPFDPNPNDYETTSGYYSSYGLRDAQSERDSFVIGSWVHTISPKALIFGCAVLPLQRGELRLECKRHASCHDVAPEIELRGRPGGCASECGAERLFRRALLVLPGGERSVRIYGERRQRAVRTEHHGERPRPGYLSFMLPIICAWAGTSLYWAGSAFQFFAAD